MPPVRFNQARRSRNGRAFDSNDGRPATRVFRPDLFYLVGFD